MSDALPGFFARLALAIGCLFKLLFDAPLAARVGRAMAGASLPESAAPAPGADTAAKLEDVSARLVEAGAQAKQAKADAEHARAEATAAKEALAEARAEHAEALAKAAVAAETAAPTEPVEPDPRGALTLLALLQREGRLVDFLEQDVASFSDADVGAAARLVHEGCRKALRAHATIAPVRSEAEESRVTVDEGYDPAAVKLTGKVGPKPPYQGTLRHAGWRVSGLRLPRALAGHDAELVAPAEVEL